jgi:hypothetical protein
VDASELWHYNTREQSVTCLNGETTYRIFDVIRVEVSLDKSRAHSRKVVLKIVDGNNKPLWEAEKPKKVQTTNNNDDARDVRVATAENKSKKSLKLKLENERDSIDVVESMEVVVPVKAKDRKNKKNPKKAKNNNTASNNSYADESPNKKRRNSEPLAVSPKTQKKRKEGK